MPFGSEEAERQSIGSIKRALDNGLLSGRGRTSLRGPLDFVLISPLSMFRISAGAIHVIVGLEGTGCRAPRTIRRRLNRRLAGLSAIRVRVSAARAGVVENTEDETG